MTAAFATEQVRVADLEPGDRLQMVGNIYIVSKVITRGILATLHLDRERVGFIDRDHWSSTLTCDTPLPRIIKP